MALPAAIKALTPHISAAANSTRLYVSVMSLIGLVIVGVVVFHLNAAIGNISAIGGLCLGLYGLAKSLAATTLPSATTPAPARVGADGATFDGGMAYRLIESRFTALDDQITELRELAEAREQQHKAELYDQEARLTISHHAELTQKDAELALHVAENQSLTTQVAALERKVQALEAALSDLRREVAAAKRRGTPLPKGDE